MFSDLKRSFKLRITATAMLLITVPFVVLYFCFSFSLENDYNSTSQKFHRQIAQTTDLKLTQIEGYMQLYIFKYHLGDILSKSPSYNFSNNDLNTLSYYSSDIYASFISDNNGNVKYYNNGALNISFEKFLSENFSNPQIFSEKALWLNQDFDNLGVFWICTMPIYFMQDTKVGYISILIDSKRIVQFLNTLNTNYSRNDLFYLYSTKSNQSVLHEIQQNAHLKDDNSLLNVIESNHDVSSKKGNISAYPLSADSMMFICVSKKDYINNIMHKFLLLLIGCWLVLFLICAFLSNKITNQFIFDLQKLCKKIKTYIKTLQKE